MPLSCSLYDRLQHPIWNSGTFGVSPTPFTVIMQLVITEQGASSLVHTIWLFALLHKLCLPTHCGAMLPQDCNLVEYTGNQAAVYSSGTYNVANKPCSLVVSSTQGGNIFVVDATGKAVFSAPNPLPSPPTSAPPASSAAPVTSAPPATTSKAPATSVAPPTTPPVSFGSGTLLAGQDLQQVCLRTGDAITCAALDQGGEPHRHACPPPALAGVQEGVVLQGVPLYSPDGGAYLLAQADGNLVLYSKVHARFCRDASAQSASALR